MADRRRNHFIPRFLLARFASRRDGKKSWVWQVSQEGDALEISTRDAAVATDFYGGAETGVEDAFAEAEGEFARALSRIEKGDSIEDHEGTLRQLIWTLAIRTRALRQQFAKLAHGLTDKIVETASSPQAQDMLAEYMRAEFPRIMEKELSKFPPEERAAVNAVFSAPEIREEMLQAMEGLMRSTFPKEIFGHIRDMVRDRGILQEAAEKGQVEGLIRLLKDSKVPDSFSPSYWQVYKVAPHLMVLGDVCVVAVRADGTFGSLLQGVQEWETLYLPISPSAVLVAARRAPASLLDVEQINHASAGLSWSHLYSSKMSDWVRSLASTIGSIAPILSDQDISDLASESWGR